MNATPKMSEYLEFRNGAGNFTFRSGKRHKFTVKVNKTDNGGTAE